MFARGVTCIASMPYGLRLMPPINVFGYGGRESPTGLHHSGMDFITTCLHMRLATWLKMSMDGATVLVTRVDIHDAHIDRPNATLKLVDREAHVVFNELCQSRVVSSLDNVDLHFWPLNDEHAWS